MGCDSCNFAAWADTCTNQLQVKKGQQHASEVVRGLSPQQQELFTKAREGKGRSKMYVNTWGALVHLFKRTRESCRCCSY